MKFVILFGFAGFLAICAAFLARALDRDSAVRQWIRWRWLGSRVAKSTHPYALRSQFASSPTMTVKYRSPTVGSEKRRSERTAAAG